MLLRSSLLWVYLVYFVLSLLLFFPLSHTHFIIVVLQKSERGVFQCVREMKRPSAQLGPSVATLADIIHASLAVSHRARDCLKGSLAMKDREWHTWCSIDAGRELTRQGKWLALSVAHSSGFKWQPKRCCFYVISQSVRWSATACAAFVAWSFNRFLKFFYFVPVGCHQISLYLTWSLFHSN